MSYSSLDIYGRIVNVRMCLFEILGAAPWGRTQREQLQVKQAAEAIRCRHTVAEQREVLQPRQLLQARQVSDGVEGGVQAHQRRRLHQPRSASRWRVSLRAGPDTEWVLWNGAVYATASDTPANISLLTLGQAPVQTDTAGFISTVA